ncbi:unnamed protein product [Thelazia callipaeda]|uniref:Thioredoxin domain-containing protein n=1 Tax=Thelazia callipaeda TaxID=103827 RepID=A0A0N5CM92_THECL|nr:unnamed protein product [Thelazia callipaeda]
MCSIALLFMLFSTPIIANTKTKKNLVIEFAKKPGSSIFDGKATSYYAVLIESKESEDYDDALDEFTKAAENFEQEVRFVYINSDEEENWFLIEFLGLIAEDIPGIIFINLKEGLKKYKADINEITKAEIISFVQSCLNGEAIPFLKTDEIPDDWDKGTVVELVGRNFEKQVYDKKRTTFVLFYAPWCAACQQTMPILEKLGEQYKDKKQLVIARMNSVNNEVSGIPILDVPTMALFIKGSKKPIYYVEDERTTSAFAKFIEKNLKVEELSNINMDIRDGNESDPATEKKKVKDTKKAERKVKQEL